MGPLSSFIFQALIMGSVFLNMDANTAAFFSRGGILFLCVSRLQNLDDYLHFFQ